MQNHKDYKYGFILVAIFAVVYFVTAPTTVQPGDTGELITNAYFSRVIHPPGYPLWNLLYHMPVRFFDVISPFHSGAILTASFSLLSLFLLNLYFSGPANMALLLVLGSSALFWRYSILPDVFALHLLFLTLIFIGFFDEKLMKRPWFIFILGLSVANHHTIIFSFPMFLFALWRVREDKKVFVYSVLSGLIAFALYFSLIFMHPDDYGSWGNVHGWKDVYHHFLRKDYGTFKLHSDNEGANPVWFQFFFKNFLFNCWSVILAVLYFAYKLKDVLRTSWKQFSVVLLCLVSFLLTFFVTGVISLNGFGESVLERFLLQPTIYIFFLLLLLINKAKNNIPQWIVALFIINAGHNVVTNFQANNFRTNTTVEDFVINALNSLPESSIYYAVGDTQGFATYYVHDVLKIRSDVIQLHPTLTFAWSANKAQGLFSDAIQFKSGQVLDGVNFQKYSFFMNIKPEEQGSKIKATYSGILFKVEPIEGNRSIIQYNCDPVIPFKWRNRASISDFQQFESSRLYELEYGRCFYMQGLEMIKQNNLATAQTSFEKAVELSPFSAIYQERLCHSYGQFQSPKQKECEERLEELLTTVNQQFYMYKYE